MRVARVLVAAAATGRFFNNIADDPALQLAAKFIFPIFLFGPLPDCPSHTSSLPFVAFECCCCAPRTRVAGCCVLMINGDAGRVGRQVGVRVCPFSLWGTQSLLKRFWKETGRGGGEK